MDNRKEILDELSGLSPRLRDLKAKGDGLTTPEGYFEGLSDQVWSRLKDSPKKETVARPMRRLWRLPYKSGIAAALVLAAAALIWLNRPRESAAFDLGALTPQEAEQYILNNIEDFDLSMLVASRPEEIADPAGAGRTDTLDSEWDQLLDEYLEDVDDATLEQILF